ncbi:Uncharacterised protein [Chlamydia abortus]|nr:Uncharacterised protein [Chlamydia abortus]
MSFNKEQDVLTSAFLGFAFHNSANFSISILTPFLYSIPLILDINGKRSQPSSFACFSVKPQDESIINLIFIKIFPFLI